MKNTFINVDGCNVAVTDSGGNNLPIFLFHGNSSSRAAYAELMQRNDGRYRMIALDFPGHGGTSLPAWASDGISIERLGEFSNRVIKKFGATEFVVAGQSIGGHALLESDEVMRSAVGLCLLSSPPISADMLQYAFVQNRAMQLLFQSELNSDELHEVAEHLVENNKESLIPKIKYDIECTDKAFRPLLRLGIESDGIRDECKSLAVTRYEVLLIRGAYDRLIDKRYYQMLPQLRLWKNTIFQFDCGHCISAEAPNELWNCLTEYVDRYR